MPVSTLTFSIAGGCPHIHQRQRRRPSPRSVTPAGALPRRAKPKHATTSSFQDARRKQNNSFSLCFSAFAHTRFPQDARESGIHTHFPLLFLRFPLPPVSAICPQGRNTRIFSLPTFNDYAYPRYPPYARKNNKLSCSNCFSNVSPTPDLPKVPARAKNYDFHIVFNVLSVPGSPQLSQCFFASSGTACPPPPPDPLPQRALRG